MVEKLTISPCDIVDFVQYQADRNATGKALALSTRACRHCGAALFAGESEDECSSVFNVDGASRHGEARKL
jgi:hypothetical protein